MSSTDLAKILVISTILLYLVQSPMAEERLLRGWSYTADSEIKALTSGDLDNDSNPEIVAASSKKIYILDANGTLKEEYPVDFTPSTVFIADIDNDGIQELLIGSGWMNTSDVSAQRFDFDTMKEKERILYKIKRNQGNIYLLDIHGDKTGKKPVKWLEVGEWVMDIFVDDLNGDGGNEIIIASGGINIDYVEKIHTETSNKTGNLTYVRNYTEEHSENGSVMVFNTTGSLVSHYRTDTAVWCVYSSELDGTGKTIVAGSKGVIAMDEHATEATELWTFKSIDENYSIKDILIDDIDNDRFNEVVIAFSGSAVRGIHVLSRTGSEVWQYRIPSKRILGLFCMNMDIDSGKEIVIISERNIYVLDKERELKCVYTLTGEIDEIQITDLGDDEYLDCIISSGDILSVYELNSSGFIKMQEAERYYRKAETHYRSGNYEDALESLKNASLIYSELGNSERILLCESLSKDINTALKEHEKNTAYQLYRTSVSRYYLREYEEAKEYAVKALEIYTLLEDEEGIYRCNSQLTDIEKKLSLEATSTTTTIEEVTTLTEEDNLMNMNVILLLIIIVILIALGLHKVISKKSKQGKG